jgi:hypothetical protein
MVVFKRNNWNARSQKTDDFFFATITIVTPAFPILDTEYVIPQQLANTRAEQTSQVNSGRLRTEIDLNQTINVDL